MNLITFNPFRTIGMPGIDYVKPENMFKEQSRIEQADLCLFPENWQVNSLVYGLKKKIFPSIESIHLGYNKIEMTRAMWTVCPNHVPYTLILGSTPKTIQDVLETFPFPFVAKTTRSSMGRGVFLIQNEADFHSYATNHDVLYVQEYIESHRDLRLCLIGNKVVNSYWRESSGFKNNVAQGGVMTFTDIPQAAITLVEDVASRLSLDHVGFDVIERNGQYYILEFNTLFGNQGFLAQGIRVEDFIFDHIKSL
ncbi:MULTISPECIES: ATP-grasp domain-containing protein [Shouchella]|uniref:ATP-grasp domain-containing protein n=2 Tax=Shouchella TaxID=2893057 RepID=A0ABY7W627_9BACI|nr:MULTISPECIES: ATP-grasp domain-containing protein [Shouchella]MED4127409.1 ATP-grasp domain-containing protein [Shouchella miscanthi]WDF03879.1 ATP-grasp domain-containing protein [Shouchella hunanensis]